MPEWQSHGANTSNDRISAMLGGTVWGLWYYSSRTQDVLSKVTEVT